MSTTSTVHADAVDRLAEALPEVGSHVRVELPLQPHQSHRRLQRPHDDRVVGR